MNDASSATRTLLLISVPRESGSVSIAFHSSAMPRSLPRARSSRHCGSRHVHHADPRRAALSATGRSSRGARAGPSTSPIDPVDRHIRSGSDRRGSLAEDEQVRRLASAAGVTSNRALAVDDRQRIAVVIHDAADGSRTPSAPPPRPMRPPPPRRPRSAARTTPPLKLEGEQAIAGAHPHVRMSASKTGLEGVHALAPPVSSPRVR